MQEKDEIESEEYALKRKRFMKLYKRFLLMSLSFMVFFVLIRAIVSNEKISPLIIFPVFILTVIQCATYYKEMSKLKKEIKNSSSNSNRT
jgi:archaellum biogenesis protein FlaJ (TadC family)